MTKKKVNRIRKTGVWVLALIVLAAAFTGCGKKDTGSKEVSSVSSQKKEEREEGKETKNTSNQNKKEDQNAEEPEEKDTQADAAEVLDTTEVDKKEQDKKDVSSDSDEKPKGDGTEGLEPEKRQTREISDYIWDVRGLIEVLELQETEPEGLPERYERDGISLDFSEEGYAFTLQNLAAEELTVCGVKIGESGAETKRKMEAAGWVEVEGLEGNFINVIDDRYFNCDMRTDDQGNVAGWYFCNWPEGDGIIMEELMKLEQNLSEEPESTPEPEEEGEQAVQAKRKVYAGEYLQEQLRSGDAESGRKGYIVKTSDITATSFDFSIYSYAFDFEAGQEKEDLVFRKHTAVFVEDGTKAVYDGKEYDLTFTFPDNSGTRPDAVYMQISGYEPVEGLTFSNSNIPGHEFE